MPNRRIRFSSKYNSLIDFTDSNTLTYTSNESSNVSHDQTAIYFLSSLLSVYCPGTTINKLILGNMFYTDVFYTILNNFPITHVCFEGLNAVDFSKIPMNKSITKITISTVERGVIYNNPVLRTNTLLSLTCTKCGITFIDLYLPETLEYLDCSSNKITYLDNLPCSLKTLICSNNTICTLDSLPNCLEYLDCSYNKLKSLSGLSPALETLNCEYNQLSMICLKKIKCLTNLNVSGNYISILNYICTSFCTCTRTCTCTCKCAQVQTLYADMMNINPSFTETNIGIISINLINWTKLHKVIFTLKYSENHGGYWLEDIDFVNRSIVVCIDIPPNVKFFIANYMLFVQSSIIMGIFDKSTFFKIHSRHESSIRREMLERNLDNLGIGNYSII